MPGVTYINAPITISSKLLRSVAISLFIFSGCEDQCTNYEQVLNRIDRPIQFSGRIKEKTRDLSYNGKNRPILILEHGMSYYPEASDLFENCKVGDSIHKDTGSLIVTITYKETGLVDRLHPMCKGRWIE